VGTYLCVIKTRVSTHSPEQTPYTGFIHPPPVWSHPAGAAMAGWSTDIDPGLPKIIFGQEFGGLTSYDTLGILGQFSFWGLHGRQAQWQERQSSDEHPASGAGAWADQPEAGGGLGAERSGGAVVRQEGAGGAPMTFTKQDIDALVDGLVANGALRSASSYGLASDLYLAAGLTAEGERKPEWVRCWLVQYPFVERSVELADPYLNPGGFRGVIPDTFFPDYPESR
jgi:hypothetical protein